MGRLVYRRLFPTWETRAQAIGVPGVRTIANGTTHVIFGPEDFIARLTALVPKTPDALDSVSRGVRAGSGLRAHAVPSGRDRRCKGCAEAADAGPEVARHRPMSWAARLKHVFAIEIATCWRCEGTLRVIASIEERDAIERILGHLGRDHHAWLG